MQPHANPQYSHQSNISFGYSSAVCHDSRTFQWCTKAQMSVCVLLKCTVTMTFIFLSLCDVWTSDLFRCDTTCIWDHCCKNTFNNPNLGSFRSSTFSLCFMLLSDLFVISPRYLWGMRTGSNSDMTQMLKDNMMTVHPHIHENYFMPTHSLHRLLSLRLLSPQPGPWICSTNVNCNPEIPRQIFAKLSLQ